MDQFMSPQIGLALRRLRKKHNLTQKDLANGICSQAEISKIESGTHSPTVELLYALSRRLQVPMTIFLSEHSSVESLRIIDDELLTKFQNNDHTEIYKLSKKQMELINPNSELAALYSYYMHLSAVKIGKIDYRTCVVELQRLSEKCIKFFYSPRMIFRIKSAIATMYYENDNLNHGFKAYEDLLSLSYDSDELLVEKIRLLYNVSKVLVAMKKNKEALKYIEDGIYLSLRFKDMSLLGQLYYQKAYALEMLDPLNPSCKEAYSKAYTLFDILGMSEYKQILITNNKV
ncbi:helix-turn-helix domain-containing protein [Exiguobacterium acetylicum]|uniref:helix-turn-helix domain-containing protein n=1 Tax=Exiguobacterium acetylicum TaxID=41170 RepID=UPI0027DEC5D3|nr:helix-turn-helix domain-containing protein [Exiguobacterium acetylicum]MDQ6467831.1 helix-turn-helix domain-containing protein [Exiguobacterium acetylicum]